MTIYKDEYIFPEQLYPLIGDNIKRIRKRQYITQEQLAAEIDADQKYVSNIEAGKARSGIHVYLQIANVLQVPIEDFLVGIIEDSARAEPMNVKSERSRFG